MTYLFVMASIAWGVVITYYLFFTSHDAINVESLFVPTLLAHIWAVLVVLAGLLLVWFFYRDSGDNSRLRVYNTARVNLALWVFATVLWFFFDAGLLFLVSGIHLMGFIYISMADRFPSDRRRL